MAVNLLLGSPGSGKSYEAVAFHVLPSLQAGRKVITNLPLNVDEFLKFDKNIDTSLLTIIEPTKEIPRPFSSIKHYGDSWRHPISGSGPLYVIDECHFCLPRGSTPRDIQEWFSMHRHEAADVLLITQSAAKVEKNITDLLQIVYQVRKNTALGFSKSYVRHVKDGLRGAVVNTSVRKYDKKYFPLYKSYTLNGGQELAANDVRPIWRHPLVILLIVVVVYNVGYYSIYGSPFSSVFSPSNKKSGQKEDSKKKDHSIDQNDQLNASVSSKTPEVNSVSSKDTNLLNQMSSSIGEDFYNPPHPYYGYHLVMKGCLTDKKYGRRCFFNVTKNGENASTISDQELRDAGYSITVVSRCLAVIRYDTRNYMAICSPDSFGSYGSDSQPPNSSSSPVPPVPPSSVPYDPTPKLPLSDVTTQAQQQK